MTLIRAAEGAGLGLLAGCALAAVVLPVQWWRGDDGVAMATAVAGVGIALGTIWKLRDRPRPIDAAIEADRQLRLADLLATAWTLDDQTDPAAADVVRRQADATCAIVPIGSLTLARLSGRAWGGIGLAAVTVA
ncbi:MAG TPA: hypothetical protein VK324_07580, partial [Tepidisphaeraceae bacterium]|nr:hypothetical protein [Tepidisphaeraceae bacterium]